MKKVPISFEFFPPNTPVGDEKLKTVVEELGTMRPEFFSVTYGAGGSTREKTLRTVVGICKAGHEAAPHLSCVGSTRAGLAEILATYRAENIRRIVALRGDMPSGTATAGEFRYENFIVSLDKSRLVFTGGVKTDGAVDLLATLPSSGAGFSAGTAQVVITGSVDAPLVTTETSAPGTGGSEALPDSALDPHAVSPIAAEAPPGEAYVAQRGSRLFHQRDCGWVKRIGEPDRIYFKRMAEAKEAGFMACPSCEPWEPA